MSCMKTARMVCGDGNKFVLGKDGGYKLAVGQLLWSCRQILNYSASSIAPIDLWQVF